MFSRPAIEIDKSIESIRKEGTKYCRKLSRELPVDALLYAWFRSGSNAVAARGIGL